MRSASAAFVFATAISATAMAAPSYQEKTADFLTRCVVQEDQCGDMLNAELKTLAAEALVRRGKDICAPLPLNREQSDQLLLWMLSNASQMNGFAADDVGLAARTIWPCK